MGESSHIILIDDNADDRALVARELHKVFPDAPMVQVADLRGFEESLKAERPLLVVTDYQLFWADGVTILRQIRAQWPDCPVIMFTGTGSEEVAVEAMKAGLNDYVLKSPRHYSRLASAARSVTDLAQQRRQRREAETRFGRLFDTVPVGLYRATPFGEILDANPAFVSILGYPNKKALLRMRLGDLHLNRTDYERWHTALHQDEVALKYETQWRRHDETACWVENNARVICEEGLGTIFEGSIEDITQRKQAEEERETLILELQDAVAQIRTLSGLLPICSSCKKIRDEQNRWTHIETYIQSHSEAEFTHSFCPDCVRLLYPELAPQLAQLK